MASAEDKARRVDVGFSGGQVLTMRMRREPYEALRRALAEGGSDGLHEVETEDSTVSLDLTQVVYLRLDTEQHKVGF